MPFSGAQLPYLESGQVNSARRVLFRVHTHKHTSLPGIDPGRSLSYKHGNLIALRNYTLIQI